MLGRSPQPPRLEHRMPTGHPLAGLGPVRLEGETELRNRLFVDPSQRLAMAGLVAFPLVFVLLLIGASRSGGPLGEAVARTIAEDKLQLVVLVLGGLLAGLGWIQGTRERLFFGPGGLRYFGGLPRWLTPWHADWSLSAADLRAVRIGSPVWAAAAGLAYLVLETDGRSRRLDAFKWIDPAHYRARDFRVLASAQRTPEKLTRLFDGQPLVVGLRSAGFSFALPVPERPGVDVVALAKAHPRVAVTIGLSVCAFLYALVDLGWIDETYATGAPLGLIAAGGLAAGGLAWGAIRSAAGRRSVRVGVTGLAVAAAMAALYPGLVRVNRIGAPAAEAHAYRHVAEGRLDPVAPGSPALDLPELVALLPGSEPGDVHELRLRSGWLGFHQLDLRALEAHIRALEHVAEGEPVPNP